MRGRPEREPGRAMHLLSAVMAICFIALILSESNLSFGMAVSVLNAFSSFSLFFLILMPLFFISAIAIYLFVVKKLVLGALVLVAVVAILLILYFMSRVLLSGYSIDDEMFLIFQSIKSLLTGMNPYALSYSELIYHTPNVSPSITTTNRIMGTMDYPPLFFLTFLPFYFASVPTLQNLQGVDLSLQAVTFILVLIILLSLTAEKKDLLKPRMLLIVAVSLAIVNIAAIVNFLMLALLILAYVKLETKYAWVYLGLCISLQEVLWLPVLFMLIYLTNNLGIRKGVYCGALTLGVFLLVSLPFIVIGPQAYFYSIFSPLSSLLLPNGMSVFGFFVLKTFHVLLSSFMTIFILVSLLLALLLAYLNKKGLIPLFSIIPFLFLSHSITSYYAMFAALLVLAIYAKGRRSGKGIFEDLLKRNKYVPYALAAVLVLSVVYVFCASHARYVDEFNVSITDPAVAVNAISNTTTYSAKITYSNLRNSTVFVYLIGYGEGIGEAGS